MLKLASVLTALLLALLAAFCAAAETETIRCELAVIGGGSGGFGAALAAARLEVNVVLVERSDRLGGNSVRGGVNIWEPGVGGAGFPFEIYRRLKHEPGLGRERNASLRAHHVQLEHPMPAALRSYLKKEP